MELPLRSCVDSPELKVYISGFGTQKDGHALAAAADGKVVGAVWVSIMNDYGHIDDEIPSLATQKANYAVKMYLKPGFETIDENEEEYIMLKRLQRRDSAFRKIEIDI